MVKTVFYGTPDFALPSLERLLASPHPVVAVVTRPDRPRGRGQRVSASPVKRLAVERGLPVLQPPRLAPDAVREEIAAYRPDLAVVAAYGRILPEALLETPRLGTINVHASLLPRYRGAAPIQRAILAGETTTGVTIIRLVREMDAGPMLARRTRPIGRDETSPAVERGLAELGADLLLEAVAALDAGSATETPQDHAAATFAPRITREDGLIDWRRPARAIHDQIRGLHPWPHAFTYLGGARYLVLASAVQDEEGGAAAGDASGSDPTPGTPPAPGTRVEAAAERSGSDPTPGTRVEAVGERSGSDPTPGTPPAPGTRVEAAAERSGSGRAPGTLVEAAGDRLVAAAGDGSRLAITEIQPEGRRPLTARAFLAGRRWTPGLRFDAAPP